MIPQQIWIIDYYKYQYVSGMGLLFVRKDTDTIVCDVVYVSVSVTLLTTEFGMPVEENGRQQELK